LNRIFGGTAVALSLLLAACGSNSNPTAPEGQLVIEDLAVGTGATAAVGNTLNVQYVGTFTNGTTFDQGSYSFVLGAGAVIKGWDQGLAGMRVGGKRRLTIPPSLAYGAAGRGSIPPNTTLVFVVDLLSIG
jgi:FKBP-type peptidyl-prolyl cis-trans isomerase FkpA